MGPIPRHPQLCDGSGLGMDIEGVLYILDCIDQCFSKCVFQEWRLQDLAGLCSRLSGSRPYKCFRAASQACSVSSFPTDTSAKKKKKIQIELFSSWKCFLNLESSNLCLKIESKADWFWAHNFTNIWMRFETSRHYMYTLSSIWAIKLIFFKD